MNRISSYLVILGTFCALLFAACGSKDKCKDVACSNGGVCNNGNCSCAPGFEDANCRTASRDKFIGKWIGKVTCTGFGSTADTLIDSFEVTKVNGAAYLVFITSENESKLAKVYMNTLTLEDSIPGTLGSMKYNAKYLSDSVLNVSYSIGMDSLSTSCSGVYWKKIVPATQP